MTNNDSSSKILYWLLGACFLILQAAVGFIYKDIKTDLTNLENKIHTIEITLAKLNGILTKLDDLNTELKQHYQSHSQESIQISNRLKAHERGLNMLGAPNFRLMVPEEYGGP